MCAHKRKIILEQSHFHLGKANFQEAYFNYIPALSKYEKARSSLACQLEKHREKCLAILMIKYTKNNAFSVLQHYRRTIIILFGKYVELG